MTLKGLIARNILWNLAGMAVSMAVGLVIAPFLIHQLGETQYGLWILIGSLTGYFNFLDFGVRGSVGRYIAFHRARADSEAVNQTLNTALAILGAIGVLTLAGTFVLLALFFRLFDVPPALAGETRLALLLVGVNLALTFPLSLFEAVLWASQRFDLLNVTEILTVLARAGLTLWLIGGGGGLVDLAVITLALTVASAAGKAAICFRLQPDMRFSVTLVRSAIARQLYGYGFWLLVLDTALMSSAQLSVLLVGSWLSVQMVTSYSIAQRLVGCAAAVVVAVAGVLTPVATAFEAEQDRGRQQRLFLQGGKYCTALSLYFLGVFLFLGDTLIAVWMGPAYQSAWLWLVILAAGATLPMSQWITHGMVLAMGRHRFMACVGVVECAAVAGLALVLAGPFGLAGVCVAVAVCATLSRGLVQLIYGCRLAQVRLGRYIAQALLPPLLAAVPALALLAWLTHGQGAASWSGLIVKSAAFTLVYLGVGYLVLVRGTLGPSIRRLPPGRNRVEDCPPYREATVVTPELPAGETGLPVG